MTPTFTHDVFISHSSKDKPAVRQLAERLKADGLRVWLDEWEVKAGDLIGLKVEQGLEQSRTLLLVMSANAFASEWVTLERHTAIFRDPTNQHRRFIPLRLDDTEPPDTLRQFAYIDWRQKTNEEYTKLLISCGLVTSEARPTGKQQDQSQQIKASKWRVNGAYGVTVTPDSQHIISGFDSRLVKVWEINSGKELATFNGHTDIVWGVAVMPNGLHAVSASWDKTVRTWEINSGKELATLNGHTARVRAVAVSPDGRRIVSSSDDKTVRVWEVETGECLVELKGHSPFGSAIAVTPDSQHVISGFSDGIVGVWEIDSGKCISIFKGHERHVEGIAVTPDGKRVISSSSDGLIRIWGIDSSKCLATLRGHDRSVETVAVTQNGQRIISGSLDKTVRVWELDSGKCLAILEGHTNILREVSVTPNGRHIVSIADDGFLRIWDMPSITIEATTKLDSTLYTNAKVILAGDSGVGKSGLAYRLTEDRFVSTISTDGAWATQLNLAHDTNSKDIEREIWLWDFAGQPDYRLVHQLFMDETALAVFVFNPQSENPFEGLGQWDRDLQRASRRPFRKLLVAGRCDRGGLMVSRASLNQFHDERGFTRYLETSAVTGEGCDELREAIINSIPWDDIPYTSSPRIFKLLKEEIVKLKDEGKMLLRMSELKQQLEMRLIQQSSSQETFTLEQLRAVVGLLVGPGVVWQLEFGDFVLLQPERINSYAAAVIRRVRAHTEEIGIIAEEDVLAGKLDYQDMQRLPPDEEQIVLRAMHQTFVDHGLCLREHTDAGTLLVFPSYFKRERPELENYPAILVTYQFNGHLDEIYSTLVVRLHHTPAFEKDRLWRYAADFKTVAGKRVGLKMTKQGEGAAEIAVYFEPGIAEDTKVTFIRYVHEHLKTKAQDVVRLRHYVCPHCDTPIENRKTALDRLERGLKDILCVNCEKRVPLWDLIEQKFASEEFQQKVREMEEQSRLSIDNESRELILVGHAFAIAGEAGQIFRPTTNSDWGIDGEIEFKDDKGQASGKRVYLQLKSGDSYLYKRKMDGEEIFTIKNQRQAEYWQAQAYPVMLVIRTSDGEIRWMNVTDYLQRQGKRIRQVVFDGEPFTALNLVRLRDKLIR